jgi:hypothetical protein
MPQPIQFCGEQITLAASAARTASASGTTFPIAAGRSRFMVACIVADASTTDAGDTLDVYVDLSPDGGTTWVNAIHFTQRAGNAVGAKTEVAVLDSASASTSVVDVTTSANSGAVRPYVFGNAIRARWAIVDSGDHNSSHTFGVTAFAM